MFREFSVHVILQSPMTLIQTQGEEGEKYSMECERLAGRQFPAFNARVPHGFAIGGMTLGSCFPFTG